LGRIVLKKIKTFFALYVALTFLGAFLWLFQIPAYPFLGISSLTQSLILANLIGSPTIKILFVIWFVVILISLIASFVVLLKNKTSVPFFVTAGADLSFSIYVCFWMLYSDDPLFTLNHLGLAIRGFYCILLLGFVAFGKKDR